MLLIWGDRIKKKKKKIATPLHKERYAAWLTYINTNWPKGNEWGRVIECHNTSGKNAKNAWLPQNQWKKISIINKTRKEVYVVFDASFGSVAETSDFDVVVNCTEVVPLTKWIRFLRTWHAKSAGGKKGAIFTNYFDSNFYFEPSVRLKAGTNGTLVSFMAVKMMHGKESFIVNANTKTKFLNAIKEYTDKYTTQAVISHDYGGEIGKRDFFPNPLGMKTKDQEIYQYQSMAKVTGKILKNNVTYLKSMKSSDLVYTADDIIHSAFTKTEALIAPGSLAICRVFGKKNFTKYLTRSTTTTEYLPWKLISMYEMLSNMLMHKSEGWIKTKYVGRFLNSLPNFGEGTCLNIWDKISQTLKTEELGSKDHGKKERWDEISPLISILINMVVLKKKGSNCAENDTKVSDRTIQKDLDILEIYINNKKIDPHILNNVTEVKKARVLCRRGRGKIEKCDLSLQEQSIVKKTTIWAKMKIEMLRNELLYRGIVSLSKNVATEDENIIKALQKNILKDDTPNSQKQNIKWGKRKESCTFFGKPSVIPYNDANLIRLWTVKSTIVSTLIADDKRGNSDRRKTAKTHWKDAIQSQTTEKGLLHYVANQRNKLSELLHEKKSIQTRLAYIKFYLKVVKKHSENAKSYEAQKNFTQIRLNLIKPKIEEIKKSLKEAEQKKSQLLEEAAKKANAKAPTAPARKGNVLERLGGRKAKAKAHARKGNEIPEFHQFVLEF